MKEDAIFQQEGYDLMGAAFEVYNQMGWGLTEDIYQECIEIELRNRGISFDAQVRLELFFKETRLTKFFVPDLLVSEEILVELKAVKEINKDHEKQLFNYLRITGKPVGYLINFGHPKKLEWKRFILQEEKGIIRPA